MTRRMISVSSTLVRFAVVTSISASTAIGIAPAYAGGATAVKHVKVGIVPGLAVNVEPARVDALAQDLATGLASTLEVDAVGGLEVRRALPPEGVPDDCLTTPACVADVGRRLHADQLLFVVMVDTGVGGAIQVDSTWVDVATHARVQRQPIDITDVADAKGKFASAASMLLPDASVRVSATTRTAIRSDQFTVAEPRHLTTPAMITAGVAVVGLGVGIGFGLKARSGYVECNDDPMVCAADLDARKHAIRRNGVIADVSFGVAIGAAMATAILFSQSGTESRLIVAPMTDGVGLTAAGRF